MITSVFPVSRSHCLLVRASGRRQSGRGKCGCSGAWQYSKGILQYAAPSTKMGAPCTDVGRCDPRNRLLGSGLLALENAENLRLLLACWHCRLTAEPIVDRTAVRELLVMGWAKFSCACGTPRSARRAADPQI